MPKMSLHGQFGHMQHKLWQKEGPKVKLAVWLLTTKSWESTWPRCVHVECNTPLKSSWQELQVCFRLHPNRRSQQKVMISKSPRSTSPNRGLILVSWLRSSKEDHPRMRDSNRPNPGILMVPATERLWMFGLHKWKITYMPPRLDNIWPWSLPGPTWKAMSPHGGGQWDNRKGRTMVTLGEFFKESVKAEFVPRNSDYISRCKLRDFVNATNDNLR